MLAYEEQRLRLNYFIYQPSSTYLNLNICFYQCYKADIIWRRHNS